MASIKCKGCGKEFSDDLKFCPNCGLPSGASEDQVVDKSANSEHEGKGLLRGALGLAAKGLKNVAEVADDISSKGDDSEYVKKAKNFMSNAADKTVSMAKKVSGDIKDKVEDAIDDYKEKEQNEKQGEKSITELAHLQADDVEERRKKKEKTITELAHIQTSEIEEELVDIEKDNTKAIETQEREEENQTTEATDQLPVYGAVAEEQKTREEAPGSPQKPDLQKKTNKKMIGGLIALGAIVLIGLIAFLISGDKTIAMKDVSNMDAVKALSTLEDAGFSEENISFVDKDGEELKKATEDWIVESQNQKAGEEISTEEKIVLSVINPKQEEEAARAAEEKKKAEEEKKKAEEEKKKEENAKKKAEKKKKEEEENKKKAEEAAKKEAIEQEQKKIESLKGLRIGDAKAMAEEMGYTFTYTHSYTGMDFSESVFGYDAEWYDTHWLIIDVETVDTKSKTATMLVNEEENQARLENKEQMQATLESQFPKEDAWRAMEAYGKENYPKFNLKEMGNEIAATARNESTWFLKTYCTYTDAYGVKWKDRQVEAVISGTPSSPVVEYFLIY